MQIMHSKADSLAISEPLKIVHNFNEVAKEIQIVLNNFFDLEHNMIN